MFPAPTPSAGFPLEYADLTIPGPPVAKIVSDDCIKVFVNSSDGTSIHLIIPSGAPAFTAASKTIFAAAIVQFLALGWGLIIIPFLVFNDIKVLSVLDAYGNEASDSLNEPNKMTLIVKENEYQLLSKAFNITNVEPIIVPTNNKVDNVEEIRKYKQLLDEGIISQAEFDAKKKELL